MTSSFKAVSEKFRVNLVSDGAHGYSEPVQCEVGLEGLFINSPDGRRTMRKYPLNHISRWALRGNNLVLYTKTPVDVEEHTMTMQADEHTIRLVLDTLTCSCMQMVELLSNNDKNGENREATNSLTALLNGGGKKAPSLPSVEDVQFWDSPEKAGWMQSQGEVIKSWRRRWFVLKQGFLFRFSSPDIDATSKPRGVVDLSKVTDVSEARTQTSKPNSLKLSTETGGYVAYICDSETELVEWFSALEGAVARIVKLVAGVEEEEVPRAKDTSQSEWAKQLQKGFNNAGGGGSAHSKPRDSNPMVQIVGYDLSGGSSGGGPSSSRPASGGYGADSGGYSSEQEYGNSGRYNYGNIAGIAGIVDEPRRGASKPTSSYSDSFVKVDYPAYPVLAPSPASSQPPYGSSSYGQLQEQPNYQAQQPSSYGGYGGAYETRPPQSGGGYGGGGGAGGYNTSLASARQEAPAYASPAWQVHYTPEGQPYYHNSRSGATQWEAPAGMA